MNKKLNIAIIGAGASGIAAAVQLLRRGDADVTLFEKAASVGGTWRDNDYPGLTCDVPSHLYRYSFAPKPDWPREYATGPEIRAYLEEVASSHGLQAVLQTGTEIIDARWDAADALWHLTSENGPAGQFHVVISAVGVLHKPMIPKFEGVADFAGTAFHSSRWPKGLELSGKRVGIIGAGSTSVQILPAIVDEVDQVSLFMRTPQWIFPAENKPIPPAKMEKFGQDPLSVRALYDFLAEALNHKFAAAMVGENPEGHAAARAACIANLMDNVHDPDLRRRLTPDYEVGCKRLIVSTRFYPAMQNPKAALVDTGILRIEPEGIRTTDGVLHPLDILVFATGFDTFNFFRPMRIHGEGGQELGELWDQSSRAHRSVTVPGFPNLFFIGGPNSPIGNFSFIMTAERQLDYILGLIDTLQSGAARAIQPRPEAMDRFLDEIEGAMHKTVWVAGGCTSWYFDRSGKVVAWPWTYEVFEQSMRSPDLEEFTFS